MYPAHGGLYHLVWGLALLRPRQRHPWESSWETPHSALTPADHAAPAATASPREANPTLTPFPAQFGGLLSPQCLPGPPCPSRVPVPHARSRPRALSQRVMRPGVQSALRVSPAWAVGARMQTDPGGASPSRAVAPMTLPLQAQNCGCEGTVSHCDPSREGHGVSAMPRTRRGDLQSRRRRLRLGAHLPTPGRRYRDVR